MNFKALVDIHLFIKIMDDLCLFSNRIILIILLNRETVRFNITIFQVFSRESMLKKLTANTYTYHPNSCNKLKFL